MTTFVDNQTIITASWLNKVETALPDSGDLVVSKTSGVGMKVDTTTPTFGWKDMLGIVQPDAGGANAPSLNAFIGGSVRRWAFSATDKIDCEFHIPHDYVPGTDLYIHTHWSHNGTAISGSLQLTYAMTYAKGHNQAIFSTEKSITQTISTPDIATIPRYIHRIDEVQISDATGSGNYLNSSLLEVDGVIGVNLTVTTIPTITGGSPNEPYIFFVDIHYQSTNLPTKNRSPNFYS